MRLLVLLLTFSLTACVSAKPDKTQEPPALVLKPAAFEDLPGWQHENFDRFAQAFTRSCDKIQKKSSGLLFGSDSKWGRVEDWQNACRAFAEKEWADLSEFFEYYFQPYAVYADDDPAGLFTGYYEASLKGSHTRQGPYQYPLRARPDDLVMVQLGDFRDTLKGERIAGRVIGGNLTPYETRTEIERGALPAEQDKVLVWVDDPIDAFFVQIQGSGVVQMDNGSVMRIGYAGQNGHIYTAIGRELIARGELEKENVSMQSIRKWLKAHPEQAAEVMNVNDSYVFFEQIHGEGPVGGQGVALTATRSLAIDHSLIPYGVPMWLEAAYPDPQYTDIRRLMVTQDTGGAIRGPVRGDFFWGYGEFSEAQAGVMKSAGRYWALIPKPLQN